MKKVLTIAGSDCSGGAGIQADLKTFFAFGTYGMSVVVSVVAENTSYVSDIHNIPSDIIKKQIDCVFDDVEVDALKIGMLSNCICMEAVADRLNFYKPANIVVDPVMYAKNGSLLMDLNSIDTLIQKIIPFADVLTPNIREAEHLSGIKIDSFDKVAVAAEKIYALGCKSVVVKNFKINNEAVDIMYDGKNVHKFTVPLILTDNTHGSGCTYSAAIACGLAYNKSFDKAISAAKIYVTEAISSSIKIGKGNGALNHCYRKEID